MKIYVVPNGQDINLKFFSLNQKGIRKTITRNGTRGIVPDVGWVVTEDDVLAIQFRLTPESSLKQSKITTMPKKNYFEFLGIS